MKRLEDIVARLRAPDGCPWDRAQDHQTLKPYLIEEAYEVLEALEAGSPDALCEELGDLLLQIVFHAQLGREAGRFDLSDVEAGIVGKMIRRHPHVFGDEPAAESAAVVQERWEQRKRRERGAASVLDGVPRALPALRLARRLADKAASVGFDWPDIAGPRAKVTEELGELEEALAAEDADSVREEYGDLLFAVVNLGRFLGVDAEDALRATAAKFERRFRHVEARLFEEGLRPEDTDLERMDALWNDAKRLGASPTDRREDPR